MKRTIYYPIVTVNGVKELDFKDTNIRKFTTKRDVMYYRVSQADLLAPDNIAKKIYGNERYWWVICLVNNIRNIRTDISVGDLLTVPDALDIIDFIKKARKR